MKIKSERGITTIDITVSIILITVFVALIATLMYNLNSNTDALEKRTVAINYAIDTIENLKAQEFSDLQDTDEQNNSFENIDSTGYSRKITITDYANLPENSGDNTILSGLVKKVTVEIAYKEGDTTQTVELSTVIAKND